MTKFIAFVRGVMEFRSDVTTAYDDYACEICYDRGRELAHKFTFRRFDY